MNLLRSAIVVSILFAGPAQAAELQPGVAAPDQMRVERLSESVRQATAIRQIKRIQYALNHYREAGMWGDAAQLFTRDATAKFSRGEARGRAAILAQLRSEGGASGSGKVGLKEGVLNTHLLLSPVISFDPDGRRARGRWHELSMTGSYGSAANWAGGIYENEYAEEDGHWKIARLHYYPSFSGPYTPGWRNADRSDTVTIVPFHYTPDRAGTPISVSLQPGRGDRAGANEAAKVKRVGELRGELARLRDESQVQNLQNAYGFYFDRRMWDDVADLFAADGSLEIAQRGVHVGRAGIRRALEQFGPQGLGVGDLNDHAQLQPVVTVASDGMSAAARGTELVMAGKNGGDAVLGINIHENRYVKIDGKWRISTVHVYQRMRTDYQLGWAKSALPASGPDAAFPADRPPSLVYSSYPASFMPPMHFANPATARRRAAVPVMAAGEESLEAVLVAAERELDGVVAVDASENVSNAYGYYIDEFLWDNTADLFSEKGEKELSYIGNYVGRERIRQSLFARYGNAGRRAAGMAIHQKTQPYVTVAPDGQSARIRSRLFQVNSARDADGSYIAGIYENSVVRENGVWKISRMDLDYTWTAPYTGGWARVPDGASRRFAPQAPTISVAPDGPLRGVAYAPYPQLATMAFHFRNPVSGRDPPELLPP